MTTNDLFEKKEWEGQWEEECREAEASTKMVGYMVIFFFFTCAATLVAFLLRHRTLFADAAAWVSGHIGYSFGAAFAVLGLGLVAASLFSRDADIGGRCLAAILGALCIALGGNMLVGAAVAAA